RNERVLQVFARVLWNLQSGSLRIDRTSYQGAAGVRYKPISSQNLFVGAEKLFRLGSASDSNVLLRALYSREQGHELGPGKALSRYSLIFADAGYFVK